MNRTHRPMRRATLALAALGAIAAAAAVAPGTAAAQENWPSKPVTIIVPFPAGGMTDLLARRIAKDMA